MKNVTEGVCRLMHDEMSSEKFNIYYCCGFFIQHKIDHLHFCFQSLISDLPLCSIATPWAFNLKWADVQCFERRVLQIPWDLLCSSTKTSSAQTHSNVPTHRRRSKGINGACCDGNCRTCKRESHFLLPFVVVLVLVLVV